MIEQFQKHYGAGLKPRMFRAPGRVNLIGEHTDYNLGFVMPIALDMACYVAAAQASGGKIEVYSLDRQEGFSFEADAARAKPAHNWSDYVMGVARELATRGVRVAPMKLMLHSEVPEGAGLSSSAALEVSSAFAFLNGRSYSPLEIAKLCQRAEIDFVGMPCGIMDQYISVFGKDQKALEIDCRSLSHREVSLPGGATIMAVNSSVKHELGSSAYADRVQECEQAVTALAEKYPEVKSLRDASLDQLSKVSMPETVLRRARHVITEDQRVEDFRAAATEGNLEAMGRLFIASHISMRDDYEISCAEIDFLVDAAREIDGVYGARMTGGGFGGCTINLVRPERVDQFTQQIRARYREKWKIDPPVFRCSPSRGAYEITDPNAVPAAPPLK